MIAAWAILKSIGAFLKAIPWQVYAVAAAALAIWGYGHNEHRIGDKEGYARAQAEQEVKRKAQERSDAIANGKLAEVSFNAKKQADFAAWKLADEKQDAEAKYQRLKGEKSVYIPPIIMARYADLPRGYVLWRERASTFANGGDVPQAPGPADGSVTEPSGVSIDQVSDLDLAQASAFREAVRWGTGWQQYAFRVKQECESTFSIMKGTAP